MEGPAMPAQGNLGRVAGCSDGVLEAKCCSDDVSAQLKCGRGVMRACGSIVLKSSWPP